MTAPPPAVTFRWAAVIFFPVAAGLLGSCSQQATQLGGRVAPDTLGLGDRCAEFMQKAMPFAEIDIGDRASASPDIRTIVARATGTRTDLPQESPADRDLAVECTFTD